MLTSTKKHQEYWKNRKLDWKQSYTSTYNHPHRQIIMEFLDSINPVSVWEIGCGGCANLVKIAQTFKDRMMIGGSDISEGGIKTCQQILPNAPFHVESADNILSSDNSTDVVLTDMCLIYIGPFKINKALKEIKRVSRGHVIFVEFHSKSWLKRQIARLGGYHVYNYRKRLEKLGYYNVMIQHIPERWWPGTDKNTEFRSVITAKC